MPYFNGKAKKYYKNEVVLNLLCVAPNVEGYAHDIMGKKYVEINVSRPQVDTAQNMVQDKQRMLCTRDRTLARGYCSTL